MRISTAPSLLLVGTVIAALAACTASGEPDSGLGSPAPNSTTAAPGPLAPVELTVAAGTDGGAATGRTLNLPVGWSAEVWAAVPQARLAAWTPDGRLVVSSGRSGRLTLLTPGSPGNAPTAETLLDGQSNPQGVAFAQDGTRDVLVVGEDSQIVVWNYADGSVADRRVLVDGLPTSGHGSKAVTVTGSTVFYSLGSSGNRDPRDRDADPERAAVWQVNLDGSGNQVVASGVRNGFGLAIAPDGTLFTAVNQADNQPYPFRDDSGGYGQVVRDYVNENPIEPVTRLTPGIDLGWPLCVPDTRESADLTGLPYVPDPEFNPDDAELDCAQLPNTMVGLPAHSAPLGLAFTAGTAIEGAVGNGALITAHGSWNRQPPRPPYVAFSAWDAGTATLRAPVELVTGFQQDDGSRWGRAVTAIPGPDGSLYVTDDDAGLIYRITPGA
ncbi:MAG: hypothetical protein KF727_01725 [Microbacteriaceae bacterium]|nr:hypothetical protein [Microbacteriaceae bacterium]